MKYLLEYLGQNKMFFKHDFKSYFILYFFPVADILLGIASQ